MKMEMTLETFDPANETETVIADTRAGTRPVGALLPALAGATLYVSSRAEVQADGSGFEPLLLGEAGKPLVAAFTTPERATLHRDRADYLLGMPGDAFFRRLPPGYGVVVNPGFAAQLVVDAEAIARLQATPAG